MKTKSSTNNKHHYSKIRRVDDDNKLFCNDAVINCYKKYVLQNKSPTLQQQEMALVLDESHFNSTMSLAELGDPLFLIVWIAQHDPAEYTKMIKAKNENAILKSMVTKLVLGDYDSLWPSRTRQYANKVVIDHADFCCGWTKAKGTMLKRLQDPCFYANRAIVRLTLCARGSIHNNKSIEDFAQQVRDEYASDGSIGTVYSVKPLTLGQWCPPSMSPQAFLKKYNFASSSSSSDDDDDAENMTCFTYFPSMVTFIFLVTKISSESIAA